jgi:hypothetical protein
MAVFTIIYTEGWSGEAEDALGLKAVLERHGHGVRLLPVPPEQLPGFPLDTDLLKDGVVLNTVRRFRIPRSRWPGTHPGANRGRRLTGGCADSPADSQRTPSGA